MTIQQNNMPHLSLQMALGIWRGLMEQQTQVVVEHVVALVPNQIVEKYMKVGGDIGETSMEDVNGIEVNLEKII
jgi:hypothetical protein